MTLIMGKWDLFSALLGQERSHQDLTEELRGGTPALVRLVRELGEARGLRREVLMVIDQASELVTRSGPAEQRAFLALLRDARYEGSPLWVVATVRSEFLSSAPDWAGLAEAINDTVLVGPLSRNRLPEVIEQPARRAGLMFQEGLIGRMVEDTTGGDALPLLAWTLQQLYERVGREGTVTSDDYDELGGVVGSLQRRAQQVADELRRRRPAAPVLPTLVKLANVDATGEPTRRRVRRDRLSADEDAVMQAFVDARLLTSRNPGRETAADRAVTGEAVTDDAGGEDAATVEVAHEALLRQWPPLSAAIAAAQDDLRIRSDLERLARDWKQNQDDSYLLSGGRLKAAESWAERHPEELGDPNDPDNLEARFIKASQAQERTRLEIALEQNRVATGRSLLYRAESLRTRQAGTSLLLGIAAMAINPSPEARASLITTLLGNHYVATVTDHPGEVSAVAFSPDGRMMATGSADPSFILWDVTDRAHPRGLSSVDAHTNFVWLLLFGPDGRTLVTGGPDSTTNLWDVADPTDPRRLSPPMDVGGKWVSSGAMSQDGRILITGVWDNDGDGEDRAVVWDLSDRLHPRFLCDLKAADRPTGPVRSVAISRDGRTAWTGNDDATVIAWDLTDPAHGTQLSKLTGHANSVWAMALSPDEATLVTGGNDQTAILWDVTEPSRAEQLSALTGHGSNVRGVAFSPDGSIVATGSWDGTAILWQVDNRSLPVRPDTLGGHSQGVFALAFSPDGHTVATSSSDCTVVIWDTGLEANPTRVAELRSHTDEIPALTYSPDGHLLASASYDHTAILWDVTDRARPRRLATLAGHRHHVFTLAFSPDEGILLTGSTDGTAVLWDVRDPAHPHELARLGPHPRGVDSVSFTPDGHTVAVGGNDGSATLWDVSEPANPQRLKTLVSHRYPVRGVPFSPDGRIWVTASTDATTNIWDVTGLGHPRRLTPPLSDDFSVYAAKFSPDGRTLALAEERRKTTFWDLSDPLNRERLVTMQAHASSVFTVGFSPDGTLLATGGYDKTAILWDITDRRSPRQLVTLGGSPRPVGSAVFSPDGRTLAVSGGDTPVLWDVSRLANVVVRPKNVACAITGRGLTEEEWTIYAPDLPFEPTC